MKRYLLLLVLLITQLTAFSQCPIIPHPASYQKGSGILSISGEISVKDENLPDNLKDYLVRQMIKLYGLKVVFSPKGRNLEFKKLMNVPKDHYSINVSEKIIIIYSSEASCFYALNSLIQLFQENEGTYSIDHCFVSDHPKFQWRGLHLDVSRHFFTVEEVKRYIDLMAYYKFNTFHWHLTDDQGWRIEIKKYPKLTEIGAWRDSSLNNHYNTVPRTFTKERYGGYYTQDQIREVVSYAKKKYITVVPEIEMPGHARAALAAYPELSCTGEKKGVEALYGVFDDIYCSKDEVIQFQKDVLEEVLELFPSEYIHIGGDEAPKVRWKECSKCQDVIKRNNLKDEHELQSYFIRQIDDFLTSRGRKLIGWDEILEGGLSPNATVMSWRGYEGGIEAAKQGHYVVMSPGSHCYFDHYQSRHPEEPNAIGGYTSLEKVYSFNPIAPEMNQNEAAFVLGGQANVWTEYILNFKQVEYMVYPRALALASALWCQEKPAYDDFKNSLKTYHLSFLKKLNVNYSEAMFYPEIKMSRTSNGMKYSVVAEDPNGLKIELLEADGTISLINDSFAEINRTQSKETSEKQIFIKSNYTTKETKFAFLQHPSLGATIEFVTPPSKQYNHGGSLTLSDGVIGVSPWRGNEWTGFQNEKIELIVDLGAKKLIEGVEINFLQSEGSWIYLPSKVEFEVSSDKKKWKVMSGSLIDIQGGNTIKGKHLKFSSALKKKSRYIKVKVSTFDKIPDGNPGAGHIPWTFMDEIIIYNK